MVAEPVRFWTRERKVGVGLAVAGVHRGRGSSARWPPRRRPSSRSAEKPGGTALGINGRVGAILFGLIAAVAGG